MMLSLYHAVLLCVLSPLFGAGVAGLGRYWIHDRGAHRVTIAGVFIAFLAALYIAKRCFFDGQVLPSMPWYTWMSTGGMEVHIGFLLDRLTALMLITVTSVSLLVHIYSMGYMAEDPGYARFFSYMSLFTFAMLMLVTADNFLQLFFGWEGVGVVSYLLIGFWFERDRATAGALKAFLVNRVGDLGFILGIALIVRYTHSINYAPVFDQAGALAQKMLVVWPGASVHLVTAMGLLLFVGAMGKSAQMPLHVWLPESMEGPTPISALIHAATMVTAGVYMLARMSPLFEYSDVALSTVMMVGATGALFLGLIGVVQQDIKRVVAYSTLSQLGYMVAAAGASAYTAGVFHLVTHAFFKALLFLGAGSVIVALHHEQDLRRMGNLRRYMPITYVTFLMGTLSLTALPPFSGFYSKDAIIEAVQHSHLFGARYAYVCLLVGAFVTACYSFRVFFLAFHTQERLEHPEQIQESPWQITLPLIILAVPSVILGACWVDALLYHQGLGQAVLVLASHQLSHGSEGAWWHLMWHGVMGWPFWFALTGILVAWCSYCLFPDWPERCARRFHWVYRILLAQYGFNQFNDWVFVRGTKRLSHLLYHITDKKVVDHVMVMGSVRCVGRLAEWVREIQTGYLYHYAFAMVVGLVGLLFWGLWH